MSVINYDLRKIPTPKGKESLGFYPIISHPQKITGNELCKLIQDKCTLTTTDVKAVLNALAEVMGSHLGMGMRVEVPELGYFSTAISSEKRIADPQDKQIADHLRVDNVQFKPMASLKKRLDDVSFHRTREHEEAAQLLNEEETMELLNGYFSQPDAEPLTRAVFQRLTGYRKTTANREIALLVERGVLVKLGRSNAPYYRMA